MAVQGLMRWQQVGLVGLLASGGCGAAHPYSYGRSYEALEAEEPYIEQEEPASYEAVRRDPTRHTALTLGWFGTVRAVTIEDRGGRALARVTMDLRFHQERHLCAGEADSTCRLTVAHRDGGPFTALITLRPEHVAGRNRVGPGSLLKVYGHVQDVFDERGGPILEGDYYRHFPTGTYVVAEHGAPQRLRR